MDTAKNDLSETKYRKLFEDPNENVITLSHLFDALQESGFRSELNKVLEKKMPICVLVEGSAFPRNLDVVNRFLSCRDNASDKIIMVDVSAESVVQHQEHIQEIGKYTAEILQADMNILPISNGSVDILINDCAINFNRTIEQNESTMEEIHRVLRDEDSIALVTVVVARRYDTKQYGEDQELIPDNLINEPGMFQSFKTLLDGEIELIPGTERKAWPVLYYEKLFANTGFSFEKFDVERGRTFFPIDSGISYRRYLLKRN